jgi:hypothetical protein
LDFSHFGRVFAETGGFLTYLGDLSTGLGWVIVGMQLGLWAHGYQQCVCWPLNAFFWE